MTHQGFCGVAVVNALQAADEEFFAWQLAAGDQFAGLGRSSAFAQPALARIDEALGKVAQWQDPQLAPQALGGHDLADHQQVFRSLHNQFVMPQSKAMAQLPILPGSTVVVRDVRSIYNGYRGFVQRISGDRAAVLFEGGNWDKLVTMPLKLLQQA